MLRNVCGTVRIVSMDCHPSSGACYYREFVMLQMRGSDREWQYQDPSLPGQKSLK